MTKRDVKRVAREVSHNLIYYRAIYKGNAIGITEYKRIRRLLLEIVSLVVDLYVEDKLRNQNLEVIL